MHAWVLVRMAAGGAAPAGGKPLGSCRLAGLDGVGGRPTSRLVLSHLRSSVLIRDSNPSPSPSLLRPSASSADRSLRPSHFATLPSTGAAASPLAGPGRTMERLATA